MAKSSLLTNLLKNIFVNI